MSDQQEVQSTQRDGIVVIWHTVGDAEEDEPDYDVDLLLWAPTWKRIFAGYWRHSCEWIGRSSPEDFDPLPDTNPTHWAYFPEPPGTTAHKSWTQYKAEEVAKLQAELATTRTALEEAIRESDAREHGEYEWSSAADDILRQRDEARTALATAEALNRELGDALRLCRKECEVKRPYTLGNVRGICDAALAKLPTPPETKEEP